MNKGVSYNDKWLVILIIPFINAINYYLTYSNIKFGGFFFLTFVLDTIEGYIAWYGARWVIIKFDHWMPWENNMTRRLPFQIPLVCIVVIGLLVIQTELVNYIATDKPLPRQFYTVDVFIFLIWAIFINFLYMALYLWRRYQAVKAESPAPKQEATGLMVKTARGQRRVEFEDVSFFFVANELVYAKTSEGKIPLAGITLDRIERLINPKHFFRANRQVIVTRAAVDQIKKEENGKLALFVKEESNPVMISRLRAPVFKKWMEE